MKRKILTIILLVLLVAVLAFIWGNSILPEAESSAESNGVLEWLRPFLSKLIGEENVNDHLVRKMAHFTEFAVLGALAAWLVLLGRELRVQTVLIVPTFGLLAALLDETIQIFSDRGSQVSDVWLDFAGVCFGGAVAIVLVCLFRKWKKRASSDG